MANCGSPSAWLRAGGATARGGQRAIVENRAACDDNDWTGEIQRDLVMTWLRCRATRHWWPIHDAGQLADGAKANPEKPHPDRGTRRERAPELRTSK
jgi:hypothetical protein